MAGGGAILVQRHPDAGREVERLQAWVAYSNTFLDIWPHAEVVLGWEQQRQRAIGQLAGQPQHARTHRTQIDRRHARRGEAQVRIFRPRREWPCEWAALAT